MRFSRVCPVILVPLLPFASGCINENEKASPLHPHGTPRTATYDSELAVTWMNTLITAIDTENLNPPEASRRIAYAGVALYQGLVQGMPTYFSLSGQLHGLANNPNAPAGRLHRPSIGNACVASVLADIFAGASAATLQSFTDLEASFNASFIAEQPDQAVRTKSITHGQNIANRIKSWIDDDGYDLWNDCIVPTPVGDGLWIPTPPGFNPNPVEPCWGNLRTFGLLFATECPPFQFPPFSKVAGSTFELEAREVYELNDALDTSDNLTPEQQEIALFWSDGAGTLTPPGHWLNITGILVEQEEFNLEEAAEAYAQVGIALADAFISCWEIKYAYNLLRPVSYIQDPTGPINDPAWSSFITTPPFPEFTSGHSVQSSAAAFVLESLFGTNVDFTDTTANGTGAAPRDFDSIDEAAQEAAISRLYGGIHYRSAIERGLEQGRCIGSQIQNHVTFRR